MNVEVLGRREDQTLEFKSRAALDKSPATVARAVVGMLNAGGGEVWIGVEEADETAVAIEPVSDPDRAAQRLRDYLVDALDPSPSGEEVRVEVSPADADPALLRVVVRPPGDGTRRAPWAFRQKGGWHFLRRVGSRNHPMSREELFGESPRARRDEGARRAAQELANIRQVLARRGQSGLWLGVQPARKVQLDAQSDLFLQIAQLPSLTGNRPSGWHFGRSSYVPKPTKDGIEWGFRLEDQGPSLMRVEVTEEGSVRFWVSLELLRWKGEEQELWPLILLEYPISAFRIVRVIYAERLQATEPVVADLALLGVEGWGLRPGTPGPGTFFLENKMSRTDEPDLIWEPVVFPFREIEESPDRCGFRLVRRVYQAFGFREDAIPRAYDRDSGRLILPE